MLLGSALSITILSHAKDGKKILKQKPKIIYSFFLFTGNLCSRLAVCIRDFISDRMTTCCVSLGTAKQTRIKGKSAEANHRVLLLNIKQFRPLTHRHPMHINMHGQKHFSFATGEAE